MRERGLKQKFNVYKYDELTSLLMRERGLKLKNKQVINPNLKSLLMRERGLKLNIANTAPTTTVVAPHAGAWIETTNLDISTKKFMSLLMRERGLKHDNADGFRGVSRRSSCGSVD